MTNPILVAEDDPTTRALMVTILESELGIPIATAEDGASTLRQMSSLLPVLLLLDMTLPDLSGLEIIDKVKADPHTASTPIVATSAALSRCEAAMAMGCVARLYKPFDIDDLVDTVRRHLPH